MKRIRTDRKTKDSYCSKMCLKMSSVDDAEPGNIDEYRRLSTIVNPKTKLSDAQQKTKTVLTKNLLRAIKLDPRLNLENIVVEEIEKYGHQVVLHSRPLKKDGKSYEIDILVPHLNLGFEVQDFWTHSRISDYEKFQYGIKSGPKKHEWKRKEAKDSHGIILVDIWEDDILSGAYKKIVSSVIENVTHNRHVETLLTRF